MRAGFLLALFVAGTLQARIARASAGEPLEAELVSALGSVPADLGEHIARLRARGIPVEALQEKLREGIAKGVSPARISPVLVEIAGNLLWIEDRLSPCDRSGRSGAKDTLRDFGNDVLMSGVTREQLAPFLELLCSRQNPAASASEAAELYSYLTNRLGAPRPASWALAHEVSRRGETKAAVTSLVAALQDIQRARGSLDRPLEVAVRRLQSGAALRAVKNELSEQFLRP